MESVSTSAAARRCSDRDGERDTNRIRTAEEQKPRKEEMSQNFIDFRSHEATIILLHSTGVFAPTDWLLHYLRRPVLLSLVKSD